MSHGRLDVGTRNDDEHEQHNQQEDDCVGKNLEPPARHGAMLMHLGVHATVLTRNVAQLVLHLGNGRAGLDGLWLCLCGFYGFFTDDRLRLTGLFRRRSDGLFDNGCFPLKGRTEVGSAVWAETDAFGQLLAAVVAETGSSLRLAVVNGGIGPEGGVRVVSDNEPAIFILAHGKALRAHDLTVVNQQLLLGYGHPFSALWALEFHILVDRSSRIGNALCGKMQLKCLFVPR